jgi:hypothetical protein
MHNDPDFAGRTVAGNTSLVAKLAGAIGRAVLLDYSSAAEAKRELKKLLK